MADPGKAWTKHATAYTRSVRAPLATVHHNFAQNVAAQLRPQVAEGTCRVLDIGSGFGEPGLSVLEALPGVHLTLTDVAPGMIQMAQKEAGRRGLKDIDYKVANGEDLSAWPDDTFDAVTCSLAVFAMQYQKAFLEFKRVLKPGGYLAFSTWDMQQHQLMGLLRTVMPLNLPSAPVGSPGVDLGKAEPVLRLLADLGFRDGKCSTTNVPLPLSEGDLPNIMSNPFVDAFIERNTPEGVERDTFQKETFHKVLNVAAEKGYIQGDGSFLTPRQLMLYFTAIKR